MKVIDAHTGLEVKVGDAVPLPGSGSTPEGSLARLFKPLGDNYYRVIAIHPGLFRATMDAVIYQNGERTYHEGLPLTVRWMHPGFPFQHVAFVPS